MLPDSVPFLAVSWTIRGKGSSGTPGFYPVFDRSEARDISSTSAMAIRTEPFSFSYFEISVGACAGRGKRSSAIRAREEQNVGVKLRTCLCHIALLHGGAGLRV